MKIIGLFIFILLGLNSQAQVAINTDGSAPDNSAMLDVKSIAKGMLVPRMTAAQRDAIVNPAPGLLIFCTDNNLYFSNTGTATIPSWSIVNSQWLSGGTGVYYNGYVGIGTIPSSYNLDIQGSNPFLRVKATNGWTGLVLDKGSTGDNGYLVYNSAGNVKWTLGFKTNDNFNLYNWTTFSDAFTFNTSTNNAIFTGRIGIKTDPSYDLQVISSDYTAGYFSSPYSGGTEFEVFDLGAGNSWAIYGGAATTGYAGYFAGNVYCSGSYLPSDEKLKENIQPLQNGLDKIMKLDAKTYNFKTTEFPEMNLPTDRQNGFTAQNLESVFPELVRLNPAKKEQPQEFKAVNYIGLIPVLTEAIQEQQKQLEIRDAKIDLLEKQLNDLTKIVSSMQQNH
ncbi:MAG: tail fiber domain-containing protein [Bacteroidetes bacterium]|nr:tail fiber domain-containing protein [Bacteroidota bacterium]